MCKYSPVAKFRPPKGAQYTFRASHETRIPPLPPSRRFYDVFPQLDPDCAVAGLSPHEFSQPRQFEVQNSIAEDLPKHYTNTAWRVLTNILQAIFSVGLAVVSKTGQTNTATQPGRVSPSLAFTSCACCLARSTLLFGVSGALS